MPTQFTPEDLGISQEQFDYLPGSSDKVSTLAKAAEDKVSKLGSYIGDTELAKTGVLGNYGNLDNNLTGDEFMGMVGSAYAKEGLLADSQGLYRMQDGNRMDYKGPATWLYMNPTKGSDEYVKPGVSNELDPNNRYDKSVHPTWDMGTEGADTSSSRDRMRLLLPTDTAYTLEALGLNRASAQDNNISKQVGRDVATKMFGGGKTEYFDSAEGYFGANEPRQKVNYDDLYNKLQEYKKQVVPAGIGSSLTKHAGLTTDLGSLSAKYEASGDISAVNPDDQGTASFGKYQLNGNTMKAFLKSSEGKRLSNAIGNLDPDSKEFQDRFKQVMDSQYGESLAKEQHDFISKTHYEPVAEYAKSIGIDTSIPAIQEMLWSQSVQHSGKGNKEILDTAMANTPEGSSYEDLIKNVYIAREAYARQFVANPTDIAADRYVNEANDVLGILHGESVGSTGEKDYDAIVARLREEQKQQEADSRSTLGNIAHEVKQVPLGGITALASGGVELVDALENGVLSGVEALGVDGIGEGLLTQENKEQFKQWTADKVGYDREADQALAADIQTRFENMGVDITSTDSILAALKKPENAKVVAGVMGDVLANPSLIANSVGEYLGSGALFKILAKSALLGLGKVAPKVGAKVESFFERDKSKVLQERNKVLASKLSNEEKRAKLKELQGTYGLVSKAKDLLKGDSAMNADLIVRMNNDIEEYTANNNGEGPSTDKLLSMFVSNKIASGMEGMSLKYIAGVGKVVPDKVRESLAGRVTAAVGVLAEKGLVEGTQETVDGIVQAVNQKFGSKEYEGQTLEKIIGDSTAEILTGTAIGAGSGVGIGIGSNVLGPVTGGTLKTLGKVANKVGDIKVGKKVDETTPEVSEADTELTHEMASESAGRLNLTLSPGEMGITDRNLDTVLSDISNVKEFLDMADDGSEAIQPIRELYNKGIDSIEGFVRTNPNTKLSKRTLEKIGADTGVIGSEQMAEMKATLEEGDYDDASRALVAEQLAHTMLGSERVYDEKTMTNLTTFMKVNNVDAKRIDDIVKTYHSVRQEATVGERGYLQYESKIKSALASGKPNKVSVKTNYNRLHSFLTSTNSSIKDIESGIEEVNVQAKKFNSMPGLDKSKSKQVAINYMKYSTKDGKLVMKNGKPVMEKYKVNVKYNPKTERWVPDFTDINKRLAEKVKTAKGINKVIRDVTPQVLKLTEGGVVSTTFVKPGKAPGMSAQVNKAREADANDYEKMEDTASNVIGKPVGINKVIVDESKGGSSSKWHSNSDYRISNAQFINSKEASGDTEEYSKDDVVLVHALNTYVPKKGKNFRVSTLRKAKKDGVGKEFKAAVDAKATIMLDRDYVFDSNSDALANITKLLKSIGYKQVGTKSRVFVHESNVNEDALNEVFDAEKAKADATRKRTAAVKEAVQKELTIKSGVDKEGNVVDNVEALQKELDAEPEDIKKEAANKVKQQISGAKKQRVNDVAIEDMLDYGKQVEKLVDERLASEVNSSAAAKELLEGWQELLDEGLEGKKLKDAIGKLLKSKGIPVDAGQEYRDWVEDESIATGKGTLWLQTYKVQTLKVDSKGNKTTTEEIKSVPLWKEPTAAIRKEFTEQKPKIDGIVTTIPLVLKKVSMDPTSYTKQTKDTILNTIPFANLSMEIKQLGYDFIKSYKKLAPTTQEGELLPNSEMGKRRVDKTWAEGNYNLKDSPARGLLLGKDGNLMPNVAAAMEIAILDVLRTDKSKLSPGYKDDQSVAAMFQVQEFEVTDKMRKFAREVGTFKKTTANSIGKAVLALMGITKDKAADIGVYSYERLVADIGNTALFVAKDQKLVKFDSRDSSEIAALSKSAVADEHLSGKEKVYFVTLNTEAKKVKGTKYVRHEPTLAVDKAIALITDVVESVPSMKTKQKGPSLTKFDGEALDKLSTVVQNNAAGIEVPEEGRETLKKMMQTEYTMEVGKVEDFLKLVDADGSKVKEVLGYVPLDSDTYKHMMTLDKEVQEAKNNEIEDSIRHLREFLRDNKSKASNGKITMYFKYVYQTNGRYMLDSNTINPQNNTIHRFLVLPTEIENKITHTGDKGTFAGSTGADISLQVRFGLGQAFGADVDKMSPEDIIDYGNHMLSMNVEQVDDAIKQVLATGEVEVTLGEGKNSIVKEIEADHLTHTLEAFKFIRAFANRDEVIPSFLSEEHDSLTSGFANKSLQMPILGGENEMVMHEHLARVGVITQEYMDANEGVRELVEDGGVGALLGKEGFFDSYKNLARGVLTKATELVASPDFSKSIKGKMYKAVAGVLPGNETISSGDATGAVIDGAMRKMFKSPFMIFNYSASIGRIKNNLAEDIAYGVLRDIVKGDEKGLTVADNLAKQFRRDIKSGAELVSLIRNERADSIKVTIDGKKVSIVKALSDMAMVVYGDKVEEVFKENFAEFIEVQDVTNDLFKVMFRVFDHQRMEKVKKVVEDKGYLSAEDQKTIIEELWKDFPSIVGPLSDSGKIKEIIPVIDRSVGSPTVILEAGRSPQTKVKGTPGGVKVNPLITDMGEAVNAGSVVPYHFIDGAEMAKMFTAMQDEFGILAIHDAVIGNMEGSDARPFAYNKGMYDINKNYSIVEELKGKVDALKTKVDELVDSNKAVKNISVKGLSSTPKAKKGEKAVKVDFEQAVDMVVDKMTSVAEKVEKARKYWYDGPLSNAWFGNMINGTPGAMYNPSVSGNDADVSYKSRLEPKYALSSKKYEVPQSKPEETKYANAILDSFKDMPVGAKKYIKSIMLKSYGNKNVDINVINDMLKDC